MYKFNDNRSYKKFILARDQALDKIYRNHALRNTDILNEFFINSLSVVQARYQQLQLNPFNRNAMHLIDQNIDHYINVAVHALALNQRSLRRKAYMLAAAGESFAISQIQAKPDKLDVGRQKLDSIANLHSSQGRPIEIEYKSFLLKTKRDILHAIDLSLIFNDDLPKALGRAYLLLPKKKAYPKAAILRRVKTTEADRPGIGQKSGMSFSLNRGQSEDFEFDQSTWDQILDDYESDYIPVDRSPDTFFDLRNPFTDEPIAEDVAEADKLYAWELEKEITNDFVHSVRLGQVEAAKKSGIDDFVWIAVLDAKTCDQCCEWRHGLLTSEIEKKLEEDKDLAEYCDATVPPAHFNCRCSLAPASSDLEAEDTSDIEKEFDDWLNDQ